MASEARENEIKAVLHVTMDITLLFISFTVFTFIASINPGILKQDIILTLQLVSAIPLFMSASLARSRLGISTNAKILDAFGNIAFLLAYACLINVVGIILASIVSITVSYIFFAINMIMVLAYSVVKSVHDSKSWKSQIFQDVIFIAFVLIFGFLHIFVNII